MVKEMVGKVVVAENETEERLRTSQPSRIVRGMSPIMEYNPRLSLFGYQRARQCRSVLVEAMHRGL